MQNYGKHTTGINSLFLIGRIHVLNIISNGCSVTGYNNHLSRMETLRKDSEECNIRSARNIHGCIRLLLKPGAMILFVPTGASLESVIK